MNHHISLLLLTKNEQKNIKDNFCWVKKCPIINEIIVIDDFSIDNTKSATKNLKTSNTKIIFKARKLNDDFSQQRIYGVSLAKNNWILWLDADEKPHRKIIPFLNNFKPKNIKAFYFSRQNIFCKTPLSHGEGKQQILRLFDKRSGNFSGKVHEIWQTTKTTSKTNIYIFHQSFQDITSCLKKINLYTSIRAKELYAENIRVSIFQIIFYPLAKFIQNYFLKFGFLDGTSGIIISLMMSFHSFLVRAKLWQLYNQSSST